MAPGAACFSGNIRIRRMEPSPLPISINAATQMTDLDAEVSAMTVQAEYFDSPIPLEALRDHFVASRILLDDPLVVLELSGCYTVTFRNGVVVLWNCLPDLVLMAMNRIQALLPAARPVERVRDSVVLLLGKETDRVNFKDIWLERLSVEHIRIISESMARSVALDQCEGDVSEALHKTSTVVRRMKSEGALTKSSKEIVQTIGFTMHIRETILAQLSLFDDPPETWQSETLSRLFEQLNQSFDIRNRLHSLQAKLEYLADLNLILTDLLQHRQSQRLEWIVVILIVIEVITGLVAMFAGRH
jgi:uncharacterized Rmd1/YagE family protein